MKNIRFQWIESSNGKWPDTPPPPGPRPGPPPGRFWGDNRGVCDTLITTRPATKTRCASAGDCEAKTKTRCASVRASVGDCEAKRVVNLSHTPTGRRIFYKFHLFARRRPPGRPGERLRFQGSQKTIPNFLFLEKSYKIQCFVINRHFDHEFGYKTDLDL